MGTAELVPGAPLPAGPEPADATPRWLVRLWTWGPALVPAFIGVATLLLGGGDDEARPWWLFASVLTTLAVGLRLRWPVACWGASLVVVLSTWARPVSAVLLLLVFVPALPLAALAAGRPPRTSAA
ncbi:hypothetical protein ACVU7I_12615, partial [Patulibacter sp. S7RM1-6]